MTELITGIINEEWRSISGYINHQVSTIGRVRNTSSGRILKLCELYCIIEGSIERTRL